MGAAIYIGVIAKLTGWTHCYISWSLSLAQGWALFHTARFLAGEKRIWSKPSHLDLAYEARISGFIDKHRPSNK